MIWDFFDLQIECVVLKFSQNCDDESSNFFCHWIINFVIHIFQLVIYVIRVDHIACMNKKLFKIMKLIVKIYVFVRVDRKFVHREKIAYAKS